MSGIAVMTTAWRRPYYLERTLASWAAAVALASPVRFVISVQASDRYAEQLAVIERARERFPVELEILEQTQGGDPKVDGPHRAIGESGNHVFADSSVDFLVFGEEDVVVSNDVLFYMDWARQQFAGNPMALTVGAHSVGGMGWDRPVPVQDGDADQQAVRLLPYFNPWCWGTWRDRWAGVLEPGWCWQAGPFASGYDWTIQRHMDSGYRAAVPLASRSQNIGELEGLYSTPDTWVFSQAPSFRECRERVSYTLVR